MQLAYPQAASLDTFAVFFYFAVEGSVLKVELEASKNALTLKHDRECNLEVKTVPVDISADQYKIEIKRTNSATWYTLSTNKTMTPWLANIAGGFHLRGMAKIGGTESYSTNIVVVNQFPTYTQIEGDADVRSATDTEWTNTPTNRSVRRGCVSMERCHIIACSCCIGSGIGRHICRTRWKIY